MKYSIVIPIYNSELSLRECLQSVVCQTYDDFEVLMINDGSTDRSEKVCLEFANRDQRFHYYVKENGGVSSARNYGLDRAKGQYITFLDSDDQYFPSYLSSFDDLLSKYPDAGHYWCGYKQFTDSNITGGIVTNYSNHETISILDRDHIMDLHSVVLDGCPWNKLYSRELINSIRMQRDLSLGEDLLFNWDYLSLNPNTKIVVNNVPQYGYYTLNSQSLDRKYRKDLLNIADLLIKKMEYYLYKWSVGEEQWKQYYNSAFFLYERVLHNTFCNENPMTKKEKWKYNNCILHSKRFEEIFKKRNCRIHPLLAASYRTKDYRMVYLFEKMVELKSYLCQIKL